MARRLISIPGIGVLNATGLIAAVRDASSSLPELGIWAHCLRLVPKQHSTGGKPQMDLDGLAMAHTLPSRNTPEGYGR
ncbi:MAG: hypothetical protein CMH85_02225 [Novosphingobium sp.]|nr:hypothetical protein [Novosphingobium sp.]